MNGQWVDIFVIGDQQMVPVIQVHTKWKEGNEVDIEGRARRRPDMTDDRPQLVGWREADAHRADPSSRANAESKVRGASHKGHARAREWVSAPEALGHPCRDACHVDAPFFR